MFLYFTRLAAKSIFSTPGPTVVTILAIGLGIAVPTTLISVHHVFARNPIPHKSDVLYNVRVDSWDADSEFFDVRPGDPPKHITYRDMAGLRTSDLPVGSTGIASASSFVRPESAEERPWQATIRLCHADFFPMFEAPLAFGSGWTDEADERRERVVVLSHGANERLFGGADSVGETVRVGTGEFRVVGVLAPWRPIPQYYDVINNAFGEVRDLFMPFDTVRDREALGLARIGDTDNWGPPIDRNDPNAFFDASEVTWIQYWVELEPDRVDEYRDFVDGWALSQKEVGRFPRPLNNRVSPLMEWMRVREVVPPATVALIAIGLLFLVVCCLNLTGLLLGKFVARSGVLGVHRALGASKRAIFVQRLLECELVSVAGAAVGVGLAAVALRVLDSLVPDFILAPELFRIDLFSLAVALGLALAAGLASGVYPAWRACRIPPALQLKLQ